MKVYEFDVTEIALTRYTIFAENEEHARERFERGEWDAWRDLGHDSPEITNVRELTE